MKKVLIDPGHGGIAPGAVDGQYTEKDMNLAMAKSLGNILIGRGFDVYEDRTTDTTLSLTERLNLIRQINPDAFISIHFNDTDPGDKTPKSMIHGFEIYYRDDKDEELAKCIDHYLVLSGLKDRGYFQDQDRLKKRLTVLNDFPVPSVLVELGFLGSPDDMNFIHENHEAVADLLAHGIEDFLIPSGEDNSLERNRDYECQG